MRDDGVLILIVIALIVLLYSNKKGYIKLPTLYIKLPKRGH
jgi:hypothetical protein